MPHSLSSPRLKAGHIVSIASGFGIVLACQENRVVLVPICHTPHTRHRADLRLSWMEAAILGLSPHDIIRCHPFVIKEHNIIATESSVPAPLLERIMAAVMHERHVRADEDGHIMRKWKVG